MQATHPQLSPALATAIRRLANDSAAARLVDDLRRAGIRPLLLKGASFARWLYDDQGRSYGDIDLLVAPDQFEQAERRLAQAGFRHRLDGADASEMCSTHEWERHDAVVELHRTFHQVGAADADAWRELSAETERMQIGSTWVEVPGVAARCMLAALHAAGHGRAVEQPLRDLARALERAPEAAWVEAAAIARRLDAATPMALGLRLVPGGALVADRLGLTAASASTEAILVASTPPRTSVTIDRLVRLPGAKAKARFVARRLVPTRAGMRYRYGLPQNARARLLAAYLLRPLQLARDVVPGLVAWRRARRQALRRREPLPLRVARGARAAARLDRPTLRAAWWAYGAARLARRQIREHGLDGLCLPDAPRLPPHAERGVRAALRGRRERCLVSSALRQAWHRGQGVERDLVVGVARPTPAFSAHAWLEGDRSGGFVEIARRPAVAR